MTKSNLWYGFCTEGNQYRAFEENSLPNHFRKISVGQTLPMLLEDEIWDTQCIAISNKEEVDQLMEDLMNGNYTISLRRHSPMEPMSTLVNTAKTLKRKLNSASEFETPRSRKEEENVDDNQIDQTIIRSIEVFPTSMKFEDEVLENKAKDGDEIHESSGSLIGNTSIIVKKDEDTVFNEMEVIQFREAENQLTKSEEEFKELEALMQSKFNDAHNKLLQARLHHQQCFLAMTEEQKKEELDDY